MFHGWENFYLLIGTTAGALIGLLFVVVTLTAGRDRRFLPRGRKVYLTPIVFHFAVIVVVGAISSVPGLPLPAVDAALAAVAVIGFAYSGLTAFRMFAPGWPNPPDVSDRLFYGIVPALDYLVLAVAALAVRAEPVDAAYGVGATMLVLLLIGIRNAWDLATFFVENSPNQPE